MISTSRQKKLPSPCWVKRSRKGHLLQDNRITTRLKLAVHFTDSAGQPLVTLTGFELLQERVVWPLTKDAPFKQRCGP